jgi:hypothetical protein
MNNEEPTGRRSDVVQDAVAREALLRGGGDGRVGVLPSREIERWERIRREIQSQLRLPWGNETAAVLATVAAHRAYWRPAQVRLLVLSESHVLTRESELEVQVPLGVFGHPQAPASFVRLLYCLGYGERDLCDGRLSGNAGSPQFWKLVTAGLDAGQTTSVVERSEPDFIRRITAKLRVLEELKARGVWLLDACPLALYAASQPKPPMTVLAKAMELAWAAYTRDAIREAAPRSVMIVGKMVYEGIGGRIRALLGPSVRVEWMYQPQARRPAAEHAAGMARFKALIGAAD